MRGGGAGPRRDHADRGHQDVSRLRCAGPGRPGPDRLRREPRPGGGSPRPPRWPPRRQPVTLALRRAAADQQGAQRGQVRRRRALRGPDPAGARPRHGGPRGGPRADLPGPGKP